MFTDTKPETKIQERCAHAEKSLSVALSNYVDANADEILERAAAKNDPLDKADAMHLAIRNMLHRSVSEATTMLLTWARMEEEDIRSREYRDAFMRLMRLMLTQAADNVDRNFIDTIATIEQIVNMS